VSWDRSVVIGTDYPLDCGGSISGRERDFSLVHNVRTGSGAHAASHSVDTRAFPKVKRLRPKSSAEVKRGGAVRTLHYVVMASCLLSTETILILPAFSLSDFFFRKSSTS
jgi:hypothetical protein